MKTATVAEVQAKLSAYLKTAEKEPVIVTRNGKAVGLLLALTDAEDLEGLLLAHSPKFQAILEAARKRMDEGAGIPADVFWDDLARERQQEKAGKAQRQTRPKKANKATPGG